MFYAVEKRLPNQFDEWYTEYFWMHQLKYIKRYRDKNKF